MSRAFEDEQDKQARMEAARKYYNGEQNVITVDIYFTQMKMILNNLYAISVLNMQ